MMMARDSTPHPPQLDAASVESLASALLTYLANNSDAAPLQNALRAVAIEARAKQMHAEHLLLALKDVWYALPAIGKMPDGAEKNRTLQRVVTLCIREYYAV
jgi:hypothetical protein